MPDACQTKTLGNKPYRCGFELTLDLIGGKWKLLIVYFLAEHPVLRFGELRRCCPTSANACWSSSQRASMTASFTGKPTERSRRAWNTH